MPGSTNTVGSRSMQDVTRAPLNRFEQQRAIPPTSHGNYTCFNLREGSVIYLPPGHWHQVSTADGNERSLSADIRIANVLHSRWICEAVFAHLLERFCKSNQSFSVSPADFAEGGLSEGVEKQAEHVMTSLPSMLRHCRLPRWIPFQSCHSDGMNLGATLAFLREKQFMTAQVGKSSSVIGVNPLVALTLKLCNGRALVLHIRSESSLSTMEYLRFTLLCDIALYDAVNFLRDAGKASLQELRRRCTHDDLEILLRILLHANVLYRADGMEATKASPEPAPLQPGRAGRRVAKRKRIAST